MLCDQEVVLKALTLERDQAVQALRTRGLVPEEEVQVCVGAALLSEPPLPALALAQECPLPSFLCASSEQWQWGVMPNRIETGLFSCVPFQTTVCTNSASEYFKELK